MSEAEVLTLLSAVQSADGRPEIGPDARLPRELRGGAHLFATDAGQLVGYAHLDVDGDSFGRQVGELFTHPRHRRAGIGTALAEAVLVKAGQRPVRLWAHGDHPAAARIAARFGLPRVRELLRMRLDLRTRKAPALPDPTWPPGVLVRTFEPGADEAELVKVNHAAFDWHPEQGALTVDDVLAAERESWFDPAGLFLAVRDERLVGFHWTMVHPPAGPDGEPVGEVYVVGVDPAAHGGGLGTALTLVGLHHLRDRGLGTVILYVESDNAAAVAVYRKLGFAVETVDVQYERR